MAGFFQRYYKYKPVAADEEGDSGTTSRLKSGRICAVAMTLTVAALAILLWLGFTGTRAAPAELCNTVENGFRCDPEISAFWGQYSSYFRVPTVIPDAVPEHCEISFVNILSRHGARDPSAGKTETYRQLVQDLKRNVTSFEGKYAFLKDYDYTLGADQLTTFGVQQMVDSGTKFFHKYDQLAGSKGVFLRAASEQRVVDSATNFSLGFKEASGSPNDGLTYPLVIISEDAGSNNTLNHGLCTAFEEGIASKTGDEAQDTYKDLFARPIQARLNKDLPSANLSLDDTVYFMELCPFNTVASPDATISPFCHLFSEQEWRQYDYYQSLGKWYGYGNGNAFGATNGVGFVNELIARLTNSPVQDHTSTNITLDSDPATFPIDGSYKLFADFSHDNDITSIIAALGLYNETRPLSNTTLETVEETDGYSASWTVPFGARIYFEKLECGDGQEKVRILVNDRVMPLSSCDGDEYGMCDLDDFVKSLSFARAGGRWDECFD